jgi:hypothetical protein
MAAATIAAARRSRPDRGEERQRLARGEGSNVDCALIHLYIRSPAAQA